MDMCLRQIDEGDLPALLDLYAFLHPEDTLAHAESLFDAWNDIMKNGDIVTCFVIEKKGIFIASATVAVVPNLTRQGRPYALVENVITHPDYRRLGLGARIMEAAIEHARSKKCYKIMLLSNSRRDGAHAFYARLGFDREAKLGFYMKLD